MSQPSLTDWAARANGTYQDEAPDAACRCARCGSYRGGYPFGPADPCLECRRRDASAAAAPADPFTGAEYSRWLGDSLRTHAFELEREAAEAPRKLYLCEGSDAHAAAERYAARLREAAAVLRRPL